MKTSFTKITTLLVIVLATAYFITDQRAPPSTPIKEATSNSIDYGKHAINDFDQNVPPGKKELGQPALSKNQTKTGQQGYEQVTDNIAPIGLAVKSKPMAERALYAASPSMHDRAMPLPLSREGYAARNDNRFMSVALSPLSTFGLEVDSSSYANIRRQINQGHRPIPASVRLEEVVNYFDYGFPSPTSKHPIAVMSDYAAAPWNPNHRLAMIGVKAVDNTETSTQGTRLTFLLDTSGSMNSPNKLPLLIRSFKVLLSNLNPDDQVAIVTYAGSAGLVLQPTAVAQRDVIFNALNKLRAGGSTAGGAGIQLAYDVARQQFDKNASNLVILATDGDFNVGPSSDGELKSMIEQQRESGVFLSVIGMGTGNYQDAKMQVLSEAGNGIAHYLDSDAEAKRLFETELKRTLHIAAKDVKVQVEFNPAAVAQYRLLGYESRVMHAEDFRDDKKDSGEIGAGHSVVALYEIIPTGNGPTPDIARRYPASHTTGTEAMELGYVKVRYKQPDENKSVEFDHILNTQAKPINTASTDLQWAAAAAEFSLVMSDSEYKGTSSLANALLRAKAILRTTEDDKRKEFVQLLERLNTTWVAHE